VHTGIRVNKMSCNLTNMPDVYRVDLRLKLLEERLTDFFRNATIVTF